MWAVDTRDGDLSAVIAAVEALRERVDVVVFSVHWGPNYADTWPLEWMEEYAAALVAAGVDVIHGHSSHHVLPVGRIAGKTVLYGPGDFVDDYAVTPDYRTDLGYLAKLRIDAAGGQSLEVVPTRIGHDGGHHVAPITAEDPDYERVCEAAGLVGERKVGHRR
jgi:poly-gamma-glutamate synthesis protein (capsule biosynthesis protein)